MPMRRKEVISYLAAGRLPLWLLEEIYKANLKSIPGRKYVDSFDKRHNFLSFGEFSEEIAFGPLNV